MAKQEINYSKKDLLIKEMLLELSKKQYDHGDSFYAYKNGKGNWEFGSSNDEPMKFGNGNFNQLKGSMAEIIFDKITNQH